MKKIIKVVGIILLLIFIPACSTKQKAAKEEVFNNTPITPNTPVKREVKLIPKTNKAEYIQSNGIEYDYIEKVVEASGGKSKYYITQIHGLRDKALEANINSVIAKNMEGSIEDYIKNSNLIPEWFNTNAELNANNLLSISIVDDWSNYVDGFLYRIDDGKRLYLNDLFTKGTDYVSLLNRKVVEQILGGDVDESDILKEPFNTISPNQTFILNYTDLCIIFHKGESGFINSYMIRIPLSEIDEYMDIFDKQKLSSDIFDKPYLAVKHNNIFIDNIRELVNTPNGIVEFSYPVITGMRNSDLENRINKIIKDEYDKFLDSDYITKVRVSEPLERYGAVNMYVTFNDYGYLCIIREGYLNYEGFDYWDNLMVYTIDLNKGTFVDSKDILSRYADNNPEFKASFTEKIKDSLKTQYPEGYSDEVRRIDEALDYSYILENGTIYFESSVYSTEPSIIVRFRLNLQGPYPEYAYSSLYTDLNTSPEAFFE